MRTWSVIVAMAFALGCAQTRPTPPLELPVGTRSLEDRILYSGTTWSGSVKLTRPVTVTRTATLTILPGTRIFFDIPNPATEAERQPWILVLGNLVATGTPEAPITFASVPIRRNDLDDMIKVDKAKEAHIRHCVFQRGPWALHIHETLADVTASVFEGNFGGVRFQGDRVVLKANRFEGNSIGVRCLKASPVLEENRFIRNSTGIFFREGVQGAVLRRNQFDDVEYDIKLGEGQTADVDATQNWWKVPPKGSPADRIYDRARSTGLGRVVTYPTLEPFPAPEGKPR